MRLWRALGQSVSVALALHPVFTLLADDREILAAPIYYVRPHPLDAVKWSVMLRVRDQWDLTNDLAKHEGESFPLVSEYELITETRPSFSASSQSARSRSRRAPA